LALKKILAIILRILARILKIMAIIYFHERRIGRQAPYADRTISLFLLA
jgi:uncharacterized protein YxeA